MRRFPTIQASGLLVLAAFAGAPIVGCGASSSPLPPCPVGTARVGGSCTSSGSASGASGSTSGTSSGMSGTASGSSGTASGSGSCSGGSSSGNISDAGGDAAEAGSPEPEAGPLRDADYDASMDGETDAAPDSLARGRTAAC
jgi:hypothetical protein